MAERRKGEGNSSARSGSAPPPARVLALSHSRSLARSALRSALIRAARPPRGPLFLLPPPSLPLSARRVAVRGGQVGRDQEAGQPCDRVPHLDRPQGQVEELVPHAGGAGRGGGGDPTGQRQEGPHLPPISPGKGKGAVGGGQALEGEAEVIMTRARAPVAARRPLITFVADVPNRPCTWQRLAYSSSCRES